MGSVQDSESVVKKASELASLFRATAREAEIARCPLDHVIDAVRASWSWMMKVTRFPIFSIANGSSSTHRHMAR